MANKEYFALLKQGVEVWNEWREDHPVTPDFSGANFLFAHGGRLVATMQRLARGGRWLALGTSVIVVVAWGGGDRVRGEILVQPVEQAATDKSAVVGVEGADLYGTPDGVVVTLLSPGTTLTAIGR